MKQVYDYVLVKVEENENKVKEPALIEETGTVIADSSEKAKMLVVASLSKQHNEQFKNGELEVLLRPF